MTNTHLGFCARTERITVDDLALMVVNRFNEFESNVGDRFNTVDSRMNDLDRKIGNVAVGLGNKIDGVENRLDDKITSLTEEVRSGFKSLQNKI